jgi:hypothetical protein
MKESILKVFLLNEYNRLEREIEQKCISFDQNENCTVYISQ